MIAQTRKAVGLLGTSDGREKLKRGVTRRLREQFMYPIARMTGGHNAFAPVKIAIEPTNRCNLKCEFCARLYWDEAENPEDDIPIELFEKIEPLLEKSPKVILQIFGEPLMGKAFFNMLERIKENYDCHVGFNTNGILLHRRNAERLVRLGADEVYVSIDGTDAFKEIRGIPIKSMVRNINILNEVKAELGSTKPDVGIAMVAMKKNVHETADLVDVAASLGIKHMWVSHMEAHADYLVDELLFNHVELAQTHFDEAKRRAKAAGINLVLPPLEKTEYFCGQPFDSLWINWDGAVRPCCRAVYADTINVGNLYENSWEEIWNNQSMKDLRMSLLTGEGMIEFCEECSHRVLCKDHLTRILPRGNDEEGRPAEAATMDQETQAEIQMNA